MSASLMLAGLGGVLLFAGVIVPDRHVLAPSGLGLILVGLAGFAEGF